uniref:26S proteasome regulatory subunit RPN2 C-terminal domain-containing protein n=1 Tax=Alexandrium monilatum TaxID=311494 RepID=A0A7S4R0V7_9DINO
MAAAATLSRPVAVTSAAGVLSLFDEQENQQLRVAALHRLNEVVDQFWHEIADYLKEIESAYEDPSFPGRELAALVASKVYYHLEEYDDARHLALGAGQLFDLSTRSEYVEKITAVAIDEYVKLQTENFELTIKNKDPVAIDPRLEDVVNRMFERCLEDKAYKQGLGMAFECRRLDQVKKFIMGSDDVPAMLEYSQNSAMTMITSKAFREQVLKALVEIYTSRKDINYTALCQCYFILNETGHVAQLLKDLLGRGDKEGRLLAFQIGFDIVDNENQRFCNTLLGSPQLKLKEPPAAAPAPEAADMQVDAGAGAAAGDATAPGATPAQPAEPVAAPVDTDASAGADADMSDQEKENLLQLRKILSGRTSIDLHLEFLFRNNRSDLLLLEIIKNSIDSKNSILHSGTVICHSLMQCGTTSDVFLRKNLEWLAKATNWAKFSATASLGVIHKGHIKNSKSILNTYLPQSGGARGSPYSEGGALYAMGIIHANHYDPETKAFLLEQLHNAQATEVLQHGACLGIGLVCMATADEGTYEELKQTLYTDTAVAGEAAAYGIGLVMVGSASERAIGELLAYAHDTQHEKIIRACALALAMMMFRREEEAETLIQQMLLDKDAILRYGACFCIGLAYVGTSQNAAIRRLLHISVSDVSDDVRRAAVIALGFVMCNVPDQLPGVVKLLSESYNPHVRYAAAMALGIACAGSAQLEAHNLLQPLMSDASDFVRQGAIIAMGLLYMQTSPGKTERVKAFREKLQKVIGDKHEDVMTRFGAILANGVMDAGGRNSSPSLFSKSGVLRRGAAIGLCLFTQMWYWFPLIHMFSLTLTPNALIGLTEKLKMPKNFSLKCGARPSLFAYPEPLQPPKKEEQAKTATAVLSTAAKAKALREKKAADEAKNKEKKERTDADVDMDDKASVSNSVMEGALAARSDVMSVAATPGTTVVGSAATESVAASDLASEQMMVDEAAAKAEADAKPAAGSGEGEAASAAAGGSSASKEKEEKKEVEAEGAKKEEKKEGEAEGGEKKEKEEPEPTEEILHNPCRVLKAQIQYISFPKEINGQPVRYTPLLEDRRVGFMLLQDLKPEEPEDLFLEEDKAAEEEGEKEPDPPEPFEWTDN